MLSVAPITCGTKLGTPPDLSTLTSLNPLHGHYSIMYASHSMHIFTEKQQVHLGYALAGLLSPEPGSLEWCSKRERKTSAREVFPHASKFGRHGLIR
ncbi:hypothetical protein BKA82DRAFT_4209955, partial [Pisolithus tinctorius]